VVNQIVKEHLEQQQNTQRPLLIDTVRGEGPEETPKSEELNRSKDDSDTDLREFVEKGNG